MPAYRNVILAFGVALLMATLTGCGTLKKAYPVYLHDTTYVNRTEWQFLHDSIYVENGSVTVTLNDTVYVDRTHVEYKYKYKDRGVHDTLFVTNEIPVEVPVEVSVEKPLTHSQSFFMMLGKVFLGVIALIVLYGLYTIIKRLRLI